MADGRRSFPRLPPAGGVGGIHALHLAGGSADDDVAGMAAGGVHPGAVLSFPRAESSGSSGSGAGGGVADGSGLPRAGSGATGAYAVATALKAYVELQPPYTRTLQPQLSFEDDADGSGAGGLEFPVNGAGGGGGGGGGHGGSEGGGGLRLGPHHPRLPAWAMRAASDGSLADGGRGGGGAGGGDPHIGDGADDDGEGGGDSGLLLQPPGPTPNSRPRRSATARREPSRGVDGVALQDVPFLSTIPVTVYQLSDPADTTASESGGVGGGRGGEGVVARHLVLRRSCRVCNARAQSAPSAPTAAGSGWTKSG